MRGDGLLAENSYGTIAAGLTFDLNYAQTTSENPFGLLITEKVNGRERNSIFVKGLNPEIGNCIFDALRKFVPFLPDAIRHQFVQKVIQEAPNLRNGKIIEEKLARIGLELLPDYPNLNVGSSVQWQEKGGKMPTEEQIAQLGKFSELVAKKMPKDKFNEKIEALQNDLKFTDDPYGKNYKGFFTQMADWVLRAREDIKPNYEILKREKPEEYTIKDKITRPINSIDELKNILSSLAFEPMPDINSRQISNRAPEMVELEKILGAPVTKSWLVSTSESRGENNIFKLAEAFQTGAYIIGGENKQILITEVDGKYYVDGDGRHRTAALKALGVHEIPAMVSHVK